MAAERGRDEPPRELRLEGLRLVASLAVLGGLVLAAIVGAFLLGRWVERRSGPGLDGAAEGGPLAHVVDPAQPLDVGQGLTHFDRPAEGAGSLEPRREVAPPAPAESGAAAPDAPQPAAGGPFFVQVFAGRDRASAEHLVGRLEAQGLHVQVLSERDGRDELFKVRVGGYATDEDARRASEALRSAGFSGAWVVRAD